jgi:hypothetical protein
MTTTEYRPCDANELLRQIGAMNLFAISGGRVVKRPTGVTLPVGHGYRVEIDLGWNDVWQVRRVFVRGTRTFLHGEREAYADEVGEAAYRASCYHDEF